MRPLPFWLSTFLASASVLLLCVGESQGAGPLSFTMKEVELHNTALDCWLIYGTNVYNMTAFLTMVRNRTTIHRELDAMIVQILAFEVWSATLIALTGWLVVAASRRQKSHSSPRGKQRHSCHTKERATPGLLV